MTFARFVASPPLRPVQRRLPKTDESSPENHELNPETPGRARRCPAPEQLATELPRTLRGRTAMR